MQKSIQHSKSSRKKLNFFPLKVYLAAIVLPQKYQIGIVVTCKTDSNPNGFALFARGREWRFQYGNGSNGYTAKFKHDIYSGGWKFVEIFFNKGSIECRVNGNSLGVKKLAGKFIASNKYPLFIGNYPTKNGRKRYGFNGMVDELVIAESKNIANIDFSKKMAKKLPALEAMCEPVEGNEVHFGGIKTFHTFKNYLVPLSFKLRSNPKILKKPALNLYLPENIKLLEAFQSNHNCPDEIVKMTEQPVQVNGRNYSRYSTSGNYDLSHRLTSAYGRGKIIGTSRQGRFRHDILVSNQ